MTDSPEDGIQRVLQSKDETRAFYDKIAGVYDLLAESSEGPVRKAALDKLAVQPGERVLEIGFGTGHCLAELAEAAGPTGRVFGIDLSPGMRDRAAERLANLHLKGRVELACGDATHLPYEAASLDAIFMSFTLELFDTPEIPRVLAEARRVLRPGGRLGVAGITKEGGHRFAVGAYEWTHKHFPNLLDCRPIYVQRSLEAAGFEIKDAATVSMWVPVEIVVAVKGRS